MDEKYLFLELNKAYLSLGLEQPFFLNIDVEKGYYGLPASLLHCSVVTLKPTYQDGLVKEIKQLSPYTHCLGTTC